MRIYRMAAVLLALFSLFSLTVSGYGAQQSKDTGKFVLDLSREGENGLRLTVGIDSEEKLCGVSAEIRYDAKRIDLVSGNLSGLDADSIAGLDFEDADGSLSFVCDCDQNVFDCKVVEFVFCFIGEPFDCLPFEILPREAYFWEDGELVCLPIEGVATRLSVSNATSLPIVTGVEVIPCDGELRLNVYGKTPYNCIAAGFEVAVIGLDELDCAGYSLVSVISQSGNGGCEFSHEIYLPSQKDAFVSVCPITYGRLGIICGERRFFAVSDGSIIEK